MEFFKGIGNKISKTGQEAIKKTKDLADVTKLNSEISTEEKKITSFYQSIGKLYYNMYKDNCNTEFVEYVAGVKECEEKIRVAREEIKQLKGKKTCPNCGAELEMDTVFCSKCGFKLPEVIKEPVVEVINEEKPAIFCANCGEKLDADAEFCPSCGAKVE